MSEPEPREKTPTPDTSNWWQEQQKQKARRAEKQKEGLYRFLRQALISVAALSVLGGQVTADYFKEKQDVQIVGNAYSRNIRDLNEMQKEFEEERQHWFDVLATERKSEELLEQDIANRTQTVRSATQPSAFNLKR